MISEKQMKILAFPYSKFDALICDGAVRSGKTSIMMVAFVDWAMQNFSGMRFGICGKTVGSAKHNIIMPYMSMYYVKKKYKVHYSSTDKIMTVTRGAVSNIFEVFGGRDESSYQLIQGRTLAGILLDEVVLMPKSFVQQALTRCSVSRSKLWFSCNPSSPSHWFYEEWIQRHSERNALYLHFTMRDNPSLSEDVLARYERDFTGVFYDRYVKGLWVLAEGLIYPNYKDALCDEPQGSISDYMLSIDYGTMNAFAALLWCKCGDIWYLCDEYYYSGRDTGIQKTDEEYACEIDKRFEKAIEYKRSRGGQLKAIVDPSAASFITQLRKHDNKYRVLHANNDVMDGVRDTGTAMQKGLIKICRNCESTIKEFGGYVWDDNSEEDRPIKVNDHAMDAVRYFVKTMRIAAPKSTYNAR